MTLDELYKYNNELHELWNTRHLLMHGCTKIIITNSVMSNKPSLEVPYPVSDDCKKILLEHYAKREKELTQLINNARKALEPIWFEK